MRGRERDREREKEKTEEEITRERERKDRYMHNKKEMNEWVIYIERDWQKQKY